MHEHLLFALAAVAVVAFLYSSVGHAGASGYIAAMTLLGFAPTVIRPIALLLNILVAILGTIQFSRAGYFKWALFWPFALLAVPAAFIGGAVHVSTHVLRLLLAAVLLFSAVRLLFRKGDPDNVNPPGKPVALATGAGLGFLSGLTGTGGGIFLTPLMLFCGWAKTRNVAATSVVFILVNSISGLAGYFSTGQPFPADAWPLAIAAVGGGSIGSTLGSGRLPIRAIYILLSIVLVIAGVKLLIS